jgi:hypothetical protein
VNTELIGIYESQTYFQSGVTGSAVFPMSKSGKEVFPTNGPRKRSFARIFQPLFRAHVSHRYCMRYAILTSTGSGCYKIPQSSTFWLFPHSMFGGPRSCCSLHSLPNTRWPASSRLNPCMLSPMFCLASELHPTVIAFIARCCFPFLRNTTLIVASRHSYGSSHLQNVI